VLTGATLAARFQTALDTADAAGYSTILTTILAWNGTGVDETLRTDANTVLRGGGMTRDLLSDVGGLAEFNSIGATADTEFYADAVHPSRNGYKKLAFEIAETIGADTGLPLIAAWDFYESAFVENTNYSPVNVPFGGTGTKSWEWFVDDVSVSPSQNPTFNLEGGEHTIRLEVTTTADGTVSKERTINVILDGDVGGGSISPVLSEIAEDGTVVLTSSGVTSPIWRVLSGSGSLSGSGTSRTYTDASPHVAAVIEAAEDIYSSIGGGSVDANQNWNQTSGGSPQAVYEPRLTAVGDWISFQIPNRFSGNSRIGLLEQASGNRWYISPDGKVYQNTGSITEQDTGNTWTADDVIKFEIVDVSGAQKIKVSQNGTELVTCAASKNSGFYVYGVIYSEDTIGQTPSANVTYKRPNARGAGVTNWNVGTAQVSILTPPTAGFSSASIVDDEIEASDTLVITNSATNADSYEYRVNGILRSTSATPNLTKWLRMGENTIQQKVINSAGEDTATLTFDVVEKLITVTTPPHTLTGLSSGLTLTVDVKAVDANDNESAYSSSIEFVTE